MYSLIKGQTFARVATAIVLSRGDYQSASRLASERWGATSSAAMAMKGLVAGASTTSWSELADTKVVSAEFVELVRPQTILGRMLNLRRAPSRTPVAATAEGATAAWVRPGEPIPVSSMAFDRTSLAPLAVSALVILSRELLTSMSEEAEDLVRRDLARATAQAMDLAFIDPTNAGIADVMPASILNGAPTIPSTGNIADDLTAAIEAHGGDLESSLWILNPRVAARIGLIAGGKGVAADLGARGGTLAGLPALTSKASPLTTAGGTITLVDAAGVLLVDEGALARSSEQTAISMRDDPTAPSTVVSMFQTNSAAMLTERLVNWQRARAGSVLTITGCDYSSGA